MNNKLKKVLSYIGVAFLGFATGIAALVGVSSCSRSNIKEASAAYDQGDTYLRRFKSVSFYETMLTIEELRSNNYGFDVTESCIENAVQGQYNFGISYRIKADFTFPDEDTDFKYNVIRLGFAFLKMSGNDDSGLTCTSIYLQNRDEQDQLLNDYHVYGQNVYNPCFFTISQVEEVIIPNAFGGKPLEESSEGAILDYYTEWYTTYNQTNIFNFANQINYYAPYQINISSLYASDTDMSTAGAMKFITMFSDVWFVSGGQLFNRVRLFYYNAVATSYKDDYGNRQVWGVDGYACYQYMIYENTITNKVVVVNNRDTSLYKEGNTTGYNIEPSSSWASQNYKQLIFLGELSERFVTELGKYNNAQQSGTYIDVNSDVGLGNVFTLIATAFSSMIPLFSIQIIPGITIGLLLFLPLITGIILLIIWIVKR